MVISRNYELRMAFRSNVQYAIIRKVFLNDAMLFLRTHKNSMRANKSPYALLLCFRKREFRIRKNTCQLVQLMLRNKPLIAFKHPCKSSGCLRNQAPKLERSYRLLLSRPSYRLIDDSRRHAIAFKLSLDFTSELVELFHSRQGNSCEEHSFLHLHWHKTVSWLEPFMLPYAFRHDELSFCTHFHDVHVQQLNC